MARTSPIPLARPPRPRSGWRLPTRGGQDVGAERLLAEIFERHHQELYRYCLGIVRNRADAEDALQTTMAAALRQLPDLDADVVRPWLFRVAHNESISIIRARRDTTSETELLESGTESAQAEVEQREQLQTLVADLRALPDRQRGALLMREMSGLSYAEIAAAFESSEGAVRQVVHEAREALAVAAEGRSMDCAEIRELVDGGDRRKLRGRKIRAHLNSCEGCGAFATAIEERRRAYAVLCPPLPLAAASTLLAGALGSAAASSGTGVVSGGAGAVGSGIAASAGAAGTAGVAVKGASAVAALVIAAGAADLTGVADLPGPVDLGGSAAQTAPPPLGAPAAASSAIEDDERRAPASDHGTARSDRRSDRNNARRSREDRTAGADQTGRSGDAAGNSGRSAGQGKTDGAAPGRSSTAPGHGGSSPGQSSGAPGRGGSSPGQSSGAPGQGGSSPGQSAEAPGQGGSSPGNSAGAPGQNGSGPGKSPSAPGNGGSSVGNSGTAPGQSNTGSANSNAAPGQSSAGGNGAGKGPPETRGGSGS